MAYGPSKSSLMQTASNNAATIVAALVQAGIATAETDIQSLFNEVRDSVFADLATILAEEEASAPKRDSGYSGGGNGGGASFNDPGSIRLKDKYKKHAGQTLAEVQAVDPGYIQWLAFKCKDAWMNKAARAYLDTIGGGSGVESPDYYSSN